MATAAGNVLQFAKATVKFDTKLQLLLFWFIWTCQLKGMTVHFIKLHTILFCLHSNPNAGNMKKVADLYGEVIGVLSQAR